MSTKAETLKKFDRILEKFEYSPMLPWLKREYRKLFNLQRRFIELGWRMDFILAEQQHEHLAMVNNKKHHPEDDWAIEDEAHRLVSEAAEIFLAVPAAKKYDADRRNERKLVNC